MACRQEQGQLSNTGASLEILHTCIVEPSACCNHPSCVHADSAGGNRSDNEADSLSKPSEPPARRSAVANAVLYGSINGVVAVPAMVSFVAIIFQARWRALNTSSRCDAMLSTLAR